MKKRKFLIFLAIFSVGVITTYVAFAKSHALDSYCNVCKGYNDTALWFLQNGRVFSSLAFLIYNFVKLPYDSMNFVSLFFMNLTLAIAITKLYLLMKHNLKINNKYKQGILLISIFLLFYNPLFTELLVLNEGFVITLGILFIVFAIDKISLGGLKNYIFGFILSILAILCYQGIFCYFFPLLIIVLLSRGVSNKEDIINSLKKFGIGILAYLVAFIFDFITIKVVSNIVNLSMPKLGSFNIIENLKLILTDFLPTSLKYLYGFINTKFYYLILFIILIFTIYLFFKNNNKKRNIIIFIILSLVVLLTPFIPNLVMATNSNYTAARMVLTLGALPSVLVLYNVILFDFDKKFSIAIITILVLLFAIVAYSIRQNELIDKKHYKEEVRYFNTIKSEIKTYEEDTNNKITKVYYAKDTDVAYYYSYGNANGLNIRLFAIDWAIDCAFPSFISKDIKFMKMSDEDYNKYFKGKNYDKYDPEQIIFEYDTAYLLLY